MAPIIDPWGGYNQGMANLSNTLSDLSNAKRQREIDAVNLRRLALEEKSQGSLLAEREAKLADLEAQRGALQEVYGAATLQEAYAAQIKEKIQAEKTEKFFNHLGVLEKAGASPGFITNVAKKDLAKIPEYKDIVPNILFMSKDKLVSILDVKEGQIINNPLTGEPLPPGRYEAEGKRTGDFKNPFALTSIKPLTEKPQKPVDVVTQEASTFLTGKGYDLTSPEKQAEAFKWFATPQGQAEWMKYVDRVSASRYNPPPVTNQFIGFNPSGGVTTFNPRTGEVSGNGEIPIGKTAQPITEKAQENLSSGLTALKNLNDMETLIESEFTKGGILGQAINAAKGAGTRIGLADSNSKELTNLFDRISADVQATIKGIPSNFDVKVFRGTLPTWKTEKELAKKKIGTARRMLKTEIKNQVSYYKGTNRVIPQEVLDMATDLGIDVSNVNANPQPWKGGKRSSGATASPVRSGRFTVEEVK